MNQFQQLKPYRIRCESVLPVPSTEENSDADRNIIFIWIVVSLIEHESGGRQIYPLTSDLWMTHMVTMVSGGQLPRRVCRTWDGTLLVLNLIPWPLFTQRKCLWLINRCTQLINTSNPWPLFPGFFLSPYTQIKIEHLLIVKFPTVSSVFEIWRSTCMNG